MLVTYHPSKRQYFVKDKDKCISYNRWLMKKAIGRNLTTEEVVHPIDGDPANSIMGNLKLTTKSEDAKFHCRLQPEFTAGHARARKKAWKTRGVDYFAIYKLMQEGHCHKRIAKILDESRNTTRYACNKIKRDNQASPLGHKMRNIFCIGIHGRIGSGKNVLASAVEESFKRDFSVKTFSLAGPLKEKVASLLSVDTNQLEQLKEKVVLRGRSVLGPLSVSIRRLLQWYGTEGGRDASDPNIWIKKLVERIKTESGQEATLVVIPDIRFENELLGIQKEFDTFFVKIKGSQFTYASPRDKQHQSEKGLPDRLFNCVITNEGPLDEYYKKISKEVIPQIDDWVHLVQA